MFDENKFTRLLEILIVVFIVVLGGGYLLYYNSFGMLNNEDREISLEDKFSPIEPFIAYSSKLPSIIDLFGEGVSRGEGVSDDTKYVDYKQEWFSIEVDTRYYYGKQKRVYKTVLTYNESDKDKLFSEMKKYLGEPLSDTFNDADEKKPRAFWIKDSVSYEVLAKGDKIVLEARLAYYENPNNYDMGDRPTVIQRMSEDVTGDGESDSVLLIGSKVNYTDTTYNKLFVLIGNNKGAYYTGFPKDMDGGSNPQLSILDINGDADVDILVESDLFYINSFNGFSYTDDKIVNIYSSENNPESSKDTKDSSENNDSTEDKDSNENSTGNADKSSNESETNNENTDDSDNSNK